MLYKLNNVNNYGNISVMYHWCARYIVRFLVPFPHNERAKGWSPVWSDICFMRRLSPTTSCSHYGHKKKLFLYVDMCLYRGMFFIHLQMHFGHLTCIYINVCVYKIFPKWVLYINKNQWAHLVQSFVQCTLVWYISTSKITMLLNSISCTCCAILNIMFLIYSSMTCDLLSWLANLSVQTSVWTGRQGGWMIGVIASHPLTPRKFLSYVMV